MTSLNLLDDIIADYLVACDEGRKPNANEIIEAHPELAEKLREFFAREAWLREVPHNPQIGDGGEFGDFIVVRELGRGGWGVVYEARKSDSDNRFALKVLAAPHRNRRQLIRFRNETELLRQLNHKNIVDIYDVGHVGETPFYTMPLMSGHVGDWIAKYRSNAGVDVDHVASLGRQVANGLSYAHRSGIIHRDVKPSNILLGTDHVPRLADFGLARIDNAATLTTTGDIVGTLRYASPEQLMGNRGAVDQRSDVYSLGATIWEMLTLEPLVAAAGRHGMIHSVLHNETPSISRRNAAVPADLETIVMKCLEKEPTKRYQSAVELANDLSRFSRHERIVAKRPSPSERALGWMQRNQRVAAIAAVGVAFVVLTSLVSSYLVWQAGHQTKSAYALAVENEERATTALSLAENSERKAMRMLYTSEMEQANQAWVKGDMSQARMRLEKIAEFDQDRRLRHLEWDFLWRKCNAQSELLATVPDMIYCLEESPDQSRILTAGSDSVVRIHDVPTGKIVDELSTRQTEINNIAFSPNNAMLATAGDDGTVKIWDSKSHQLISVAKAGDNPVWSTAFVSNEGIVASSENEAYNADSDKSHFNVFSIREGQLLNKVLCNLRCKAVKCRTCGRFEVLSDGRVLTCRDAVHHWTPDTTESGTGVFNQGPMLNATRVHDVAVDEDRGLAFFAGNEQLVVCHLDSLKPLYRVSQQNRVYQVDVFRKRGLVAIGIRGGQIKVYRIDEDVEGFQGLSEVDAWGFAGESEALLASKDEKYLYFSVDRELHRTTLARTNPVWRVKAEKIVAHPHSQRCVSYHLNGELLDPELRRITGDARMGEYEISADGSVLAGISSHADNRMVKVWSIKSEKLVYSEKLRDPKLSRIRISGDGKYLAVFHEHSPDARVGLFTVLDWQNENYTIWDDESGVSRWETGFDQENRVIYRPRNRLLCRDCKTGEIVWRDLDTKLQRFTVHPKKNLIAVATFGGIMEIRDSTNGEFVRRFTCPSDVSGIAFTSDGERLGFIEPKKRAFTLLDSHSGKCLLHIPNAGCTGHRRPPAFIDNDRSFMVRKSESESHIIDFVEAP